MRIDPTGMNDHDYKKSKETGRLTIVPGSKDNPEYDRIIDDQGNTLKVDKGVINPKEQGIKVPGVSDGKKVDYAVDLYRFNDKSKAQEFYEFAANPDRNWVEFSISDFENSTGKYFVVGTIGTQSKEGAWSYAFSIEKNKDSNVKLNKVIHNHDFSAGPSDADREGKRIFLLNNPTQQTKFIIDCWNCTYGKPREEIPF